MDSHDIVAYISTGSLTDKKRADYFGSAARRQLDYVSNPIPCNMSIPC
jgi:hypothetical protein